MEETTPKIIDSLISKIIQSGIEGETRILIEQAKKDLEKRIPEIVASVIVNLTKLSDIQRLEDRIIFTIHNKT